MTIHPIATLENIAGRLAHAKLADLSALSVLGRASNSAGIAAAIAAASDHQVLRRSGTDLAFGAVNLASSNAVTGALAITNGGTGATSQSAARTALGLAIGSNVQAYSDDLTLLATEMATNGFGLIAMTGPGDQPAGRTITGTSNRISVTNGNGLAGNPTLDIASSYVGQNTITTLGTVTTGTWNASTIGVAYGGTGVTTHPLAPQGRLTLSSSSPIADATGFSTIYYLPYKGSRINLYDGTRWIPYNFSSITIPSLSGSSSSLGYDVFAYITGSVPGLIYKAWTSLTSRGTGAGTSELELFDGLYVNKYAISGGPSARQGLYLGSFNPNGDNTVTSNTTNRLLWNNYNRVALPAYATESTQHSYNGASMGAPRPWNNTNGSLRLNVFTGLQEDAFIIGCNAAYDGQYIGLGLDTTTSFNIGNMLNGLNGTSIFSLGDTFIMYLSQGYHYIHALELSLLTSTTVTWYTMTIRFLMWG